MTTADNGMPEIKEYDEKGNVIHYRDSNGGVGPPHKATP